MTRMFAQCLIGCAIVATATAQQMAIRPNIADRDVVDPQDSIERFALLSSGGPLIVQASLTIDGKPFRAAREKLLGDLIAAADKDKDGQTTWSEAISSGRFTLGRLGAIGEAQRTSIANGMDANNDGLVQLLEARQFMAQLVRAPTFTLTGGAPFSASGSPDLLALLDTDHDRRLSEKEIAAAGERLKSRDADDNDVLDSTEISGVPMTNVRVVASAAAGPPSSAATLLGLSAKNQNVVTTIAQKYKNADGLLVAESFSQTPQLFTALDKDQNGQLDDSEILTLNDVPPHVELTVDLFSQKPAELSVKAVAKELPAVLPGNRTLELPGLRVTLAVNSAAPRPANYNAEQAAAGMLRQFDKDGNGYLEASELQGNRGAEFDLIDANGDGKAYPDEIVAGYALQNAPPATQVVATVVRQGNALFVSLDANGDGRLGLREMRVAAEALRKLDKDASGEISGQEIPETFGVTFSLGSANTPVSERPIAAASSGTRSATVGSPEWFTRMDRNGDGDLTLKEFLGEEVDFKRLDTNGDGLLDPQEARNDKK